MESFEAMFNENVEVDVEEDELNDEPKRPNKRDRNMSSTVWIFYFFFLKNLLNILIGN